jgi:LysM repeat protein
MSLIKNIALITLLLMIQGVAHLSGQTNSGTRIVKEGKEYIVHTVEKKQTLFAISKLYNINYETLLKENPELAAGLKAGETILIKVGNEPEQTHKLHTVQWYETIESIATDYKISVAELMKFNNLKEKELKTRQVLKIPVDIKKEDAKKVDLKPETKEIKDIPVAKDEEKQVLTVPFVPAKKERVKSDSYKIGVVLPLGGSKEQKDYNNFMEYYQGFLIALNEAKTDGMNLDVVVIDSEEYPKPELIWQSGKLKGCTMLFGPVYSLEIKSILSYAADNGIKVISPMDPKAENLVTTSANLIQATVPLMTQQKHLVSSLSRINNIVLLHEQSTNDQDITGITKRSLDEEGLKYNSYSYAVLKGRSVYDIIASKLSKEKLNEVIITSNSEAFVFDVLRNLNLLSTRAGYRIKLYGTSKWRNFESVDLSYYHDMNLTLSLPYHIDYSSTNVKNFVSEYRALFKSEPNAYSFQGYDLGAFFLKALNDYGKNFEDYLEEIEGSMLQSDLKFKKPTPESGFINQSTRKITYRPDYSIETGSFR